MRMRHKEIIKTIRSSLDCFRFTSAWILLILLTVPSAVQAHSSLVKSEPVDGEILSQSPSQVTAWFGEELDSQLSSIRVMNQNGSQIDNGDGGVDLDDIDHLSMDVSLPPLTNGSYKVHWTAVSAEDGDKTEGLFEFHVGSESSSGLTTPSGNDFTTWLFGGALTAFVLIVIAWLGFSRQKASS